MGMRDESDNGPDVGSGPGGVRRTLGRQLKKHRELAGKTAADFVEGEVGSAAKMYRIEAGKVPVRPLDVRQMCFIYRVDDVTTAKLIQLAHATNGSSWWESYGTVLPDWFESYVDLEAHARELQSYESDLIPGLLQTKEYHRAIFDADPQKDPASADRTVAFRAERQRATLEGPDPLRIAAVLGEGALARQVGGIPVMDRQCDHLLKLSQRPNIDIRVLPWTAGAHAAMKGTFSVLVPKDQADPDTVYVETRAGGRYMQEGPILAAYRADFAEIRQLSIPIEEHLKQ